MDNNDVKILIDAFRGYRDLLSPIQSSLNDFAETYNNLREDIEKLNSAFSGDVKGNLEKIYRTLSGQAERATDLSSRIDQFSKMTYKYTSEVTQLLAMFSKVEERIVAVNGLENRAEEQIGKLDAILEEKKKSYNLRDLQKTLDSYNDNVQRVSEYINKDVADSLSQNAKKLESIKSGTDAVGRGLSEQGAGIEKLAATYAETNALLKQISEKEDVNEAYIFEILDRWADKRKVKRKK